MIIALQYRSKMTNFKKMIQVTSSKPPRTTTSSTTARSTTTTTEAETTRAETTTVGEEEYEIDFDVFGTDKPEPERNAFQFDA